MILRAIFFVLMFLISLVFNELAQELRLSAMNLDLDLPTVTIWCIDGILSISYALCVLVCIGVLALLLKSEKEYKRSIMSADAVVLVVSFVFIFFNVMALALPLLKAGEMLSS